DGPLRGANMASFMSPASSPLTRAGGVLRAAAGVTAVRDAGRWLAVFAAALATGAAALLLGRAGFPSAGGGPSGLAFAAIALAPRAGGAAGLVAIRRQRRRQAAGFARAARRLGEEKTAASELRRACRRLAASVEEIVPEALAEGDSWRGETRPVST